MKHDHISARTLDISHKPHQSDVPATASCAAGRNVTVRRAFVAGVSPLLHFVLWRTRASSTIQKIMISSICHGVAS